jgi:hypothetical protein
LLRAPATITTEEILIVKSSQDFLFLFEKANTEKEKNLEIILSKIKESFGSLSHEALIKNTEEFLKPCRCFAFKTNTIGRKRP